MDRFGAYRAVVVGHIFVSEPHYRVMYGSIVTEAIHGIAFRYVATFEVVQWHATTYASSALADDANKRASKRSAFDIAMSYAASLPGL